MAIHRSDEHRQSRRGITETKECISESKKSQPLRASAMHVRAVGGRIGWSSAQGKWIETVTPHPRSGSSVDLACDQAFAGISAEITEDRESCRVRPVLCVHFHRMGKNFGTTAGSVCLGASRRARLKSRQSHVGVAAA